MSKSKPSAISVHFDRLPDRIVSGQNIVIRCKWVRRPWVRDDWLCVRIPNGYSYFSKTENVIIVDAERCLILARCASEWTKGDSWHSVSCKFPFDGEGSLDSVYPGDIAEADPAIVAELFPASKNDATSEPIPVIQPPA